MMRHVPRDSVPFPINIQEARVWLIQPRMNQVDIAWLEAIRRAHQFDTWAESALAVLIALVGDPSNPVNTHVFKATDFPRAAFRGPGARFRNGLDCSICIYAPTEAVTHIRALAAGGGFENLNRTTSAVLKVARRLDDGSRYRPEGVAA